MHLEARSSVATAYFASLRSLDDSTTSGLEVADEGKRNVRSEGKTTETAQWECAVCSLMNLGNVKVCAACQTKGESWKCFACEHSNSVNFCICSKCKTSKIKARSRVARQKICAKAEHCKDIDCLDRHPVCKTGNDCKVPYCGFLHPDFSRRHLAHCTVETSKCKDTQCKYQHKRCGFGMLCKKIDKACPFLHPNGVRCGLPHPLSLANKTDEKTADDDAELKAVVDATAAVVKLELEEKDIATSTNFGDAPRCLTADKSSVWESSSTNSWVELKVPEGFELTGVQIYSKDFGSYSPKTLHITGVKREIADIAKITTGGQGQSTGCDAFCSKMHSQSDQCLVCKQPWGGGHGGHTCNSGPNKGKRGSFVDSSSSHAFSAALKSETIVDRIVVPKAKDAWFDLVKEGQLLSNSFAIIRITIQDNHDSGAHSKICGLQLLGRPIVLKPWFCSICLTPNVGKVLSGSNCEVSIS